LTARETAAAKLAARVRLSALSPVTAKAKTSWKDCGKYGGNDGGGGHGDGGEKGGASGGDWGGGVNGDGCNGGGSVGGGNDGGGGDGGDEGGGGEGGGGEGGGGDGGGGDGASARSTLTVGAPIVSSTPTSVDRSVANASLSTLVTIAAAFSAVLRGSARSVTVASVSATGSIAMLVAVGNWLSRPAFSAVRLSDGTLSSRRPYGSSSRRLNDSSQQPAHAAQLSDVSCEQVNW